MAQTANNKGSYLLAIQMVVIKGSKAKGNQFSIYTDLYHNRSYKYIDAFVHKGAHDRTMFVSLYKTINVVNKSEGKKTLSFNRGEQTCYSIISAPEHPRIWMPESPLPPSLYLDFCHTDSTQHSVPQPQNPSATHA